MAIHDGCVASVSQPYISQPTRINDYAQHFIHFLSDARSKNNPAFRIMTTSPLMNPFPPLFQEMSKKLADDKKISRKEKDERILWKKNEVAEYEATTFSIFYNNALFLSVLILASFYLLRGLSPHFNYIFSMGLASGAIALLSTGTSV